MTARAVAVPAQYAFLGLALVAITYDYAPAGSGSGSISLLIGQVPGMTTTRAMVVMLAWAVGVLLLGGLRLMRDDASS